ncbi:hypothetical protein HBB16_09475 [Pseudonocardia sp. MCCB 268]|nr:hypothetical protein [Pseudonocardia cytotoxica]
MPLLAPGPFPGVVTLLYEPFFRPGPPQTKSSGRSPTPRSGVGLGTQDQA